METERKYIFLIISHNQNAGLYREEVFGFWKVSHWSSSALTQVMCGIQGEPSLRPQHGLPTALRPQAVNMGESARTL